MKYRTFGDTDLRVSELGLGGSHFGSLINQKNTSEITKTLLQALDNGINFYDTADIYGQGESEKLIGKAFKGKRDQVIIASKAGFCLSPAGSLAAKIKPLIKPLIRAARPMKKSLLQVRSAQIQRNFSGDYLAQALEASLKRFKTDYLDVFQLHEPPTAVLESEEVIAALEKLKAQGKIRYYGAACRTVQDAVIALKNPGFSSVQVEINLLNQAAVTQLLPLVKQRKIGVIARQPFASGQIFKALQGDNLEQVSAEQIEIQNKLKPFLATHPNTALTQLALQFVLQFEEVSVVIAGMSSRKHLEQNLAALTSPLLTQAELATLC